MVPVREFVRVACLALCCQIATLQVIPPGNGSDVTYDTVVDNATMASVVVNTNKTANPTTVLPTPAPGLNGTTKAPPQTTRIRPACGLVSVHRVRDTIQSHLMSGAKLIELELQLANYPPDFLAKRLADVYLPNHWVRSTGRQGRSLLVLEDNYDFMSLFFLSIGVIQMNVTVADEPRGCLKRLNEQETLDIIKEILLNDFKPTGQGSGSLSVDEHVCHMSIKDDDGYAEFLYTCCRKGPDDILTCADVTNDKWIDLLLTFIVITKVLVVLYSPAFLPGSIYRLKYVAMEYIYRIPETSPVKRIKVVVTQFPGSYGNDDKVVKMSDVKGMEYFKTMVDTNMHLDRIYQVTFDRIRLSSKSRRLLGENYVPVGLIKVLYNNFFRCRIRHLSPLKDCCETTLLGRLNPGLKIPKWHTFCKALARLILLIILIIPWILRMWVFFTFEEDGVGLRKEAASKAGLKNTFGGSLTLYLTPLHGFFVIIYLIFIIDSVVYGVLSKRMKEKFKMVLRKCLRDMRERSRIAVFGWSTKLLVVPFQMFGLAGVLLFLPYLIIVLPLALPILAFYLFPALNLTVRLIIHFLLFLCPAKMTEKWDRLAERFSKVRQQLDLNKITAEESFDRGHKLDKKDLILQVVIIFMVLISFWSITFLLMEVVSFFVEMAVYTLMGIIVNAGATLQYITVAFLTVMYGRSTFNDVHNTYLTYHKKIHAMLLDMKREEVNVIARQEALDQENTALRVTGDMAAPAEDPDVRLVVKDGMPLWRTSSVLMFLDRQDTPFTPEKFFYDVITLNYCGAPGPLYMHFLAAFWSFSRILLFLFFVFVVVMAFGDAYSVSTTNQLLATVAGGFIPFLFRYVFAAAGGVPSLYTDSVQFKTQFHQAINQYTQNWPIYDIIPIEFGECNPRDSILFNSTSVMGSSSPANHVEGEERLELEEEEVEEEGGIDMIIDVSTAESRRRGPLGLREAGSVSMLGADSFSRGGPGRSARIYRPPPGQDRTLDV